MLKYKLTTQKLQTHNNFQWEVGKQVTTDGSGELCSKGWLHYYHHPLLAVFLNPIHAKISNPKLWEIDADGEHKDDKGRKGGCTKMILVKKIPLPEVTTTQRIAFGILCSQKVYKNTKYNEWANGWLTNKDRSYAAAVAAAAVAAANVAYAAYAAAVAAADAAANAAAVAAADAAANAAANAANAAALKLLIECAEEALNY